jgi:hypothetical protein
VLLVLRLQLIQLNWGVYVPAGVYLQQQLILVFKDAPGM